MRELVDYDAFCGLATAPDKMSLSGEELDFNMTVEELKTRLDRGVALPIIDVREPYEHQIVGLPGATLIPLGELSARQQELDPDREFVVFCHLGVRSAQAVAYLRHAGFSGARNLQGGIDE